MYSVVTHRYRSDRQEEGCYLLTRAPNLGKTVCVVFLVCAFVRTSPPRILQRPSAPHLKPSYGICRDTTTTLSKTGQPIKSEFSEALTLLKPKNFELMNCALITIYCCREISSQYSSSVICNIFRSEARESVFWTANHYYLILLLKRGYSCKTRCKGDVTIFIWF